MTISREQWIADARALLDFIETNPNVPLPQWHGVEIQHHPLPGYDVDDATKMAAIDALAETLGVEVTTPDTPGSHYEARYAIGCAQYKAVAVLKAYRDENREIQRLGREALAAIGGVR